VDSLRRGSQTAAPATDAATPEQTA
jgi:hypothetical protein